LGISFLQWSYRVRACCARGGLGNVAVGGCKEARDVEGDAGERRVPAPSVQLSTRYRGQ
jgi:hypothetical protein